MAVLKKRMRGMTKNSLSDAWRHFLMTGDYYLERFPGVPTPREKFEIFQLGNPSGGYLEKLKKTWMQYKAEVMADWKREGKRGRPWAERIFNE